MHADMLGSSRMIFNSATGEPCYDADFGPFGEERTYISTCPQNYKFEGKERDTETGNDDFGARNYSWRFGRWLSADWSSVPVPVPYANLLNPQTLNLYSMVSDDPESFADLDGHENTTPAWERSDGEINQCTGSGGPDDCSAQKPQPPNPQAQKKHHHPHKRKSQKQVAGTIYNETSSLRPSAKNGQGSAQDLHSARVGIAQVLEVNRSKEKVAPSTVNDNLNNRDAAAAWKDSLAAASEATTSANGTNGATHFYLNAGQENKPSWYTQGEIEESFGPFTVANDTREFQAGEQVDIEIIVSPAPK
jgi:RHS repeat-associated protein